MKTGEGGWRKNFMEGLHHIHRVFEVPSLKILASGDISSSLLILPLWHLSAFTVREKHRKPKGFLWMQQESGRQSLLRPNLNSQGLVTCIAQKCMRKKETRLQSLVRQYNCLKSSKPQGVNIRSCSCKVSDLEEQPVRDLGQAPSENKNHLAGYWKKHGWMGDTKILFWSKDKKPFIWFNGGSCRQTYHQGLRRF